MRPRSLQLVMRGLSFLLLSVALAVAVNFVSTPPLTPVLRPLERHRWWFLAAVLCALAVIHIWQGRRTSNPSADSPDLWAHLRPAISDRVREWVDEVLVRSLRLPPEPFPVSLVERSEAVAETNIPSDHERVRQWAISADVLTLYDTTRGQVLVLGEAGTGKTTLLLRIADSLLRRADRDPLNPMPVIFQAANWSDGDRLFNQWLIDEMHRRYGIPRRAAASFVEYHKIVPLLDGIDELPDSRRAAFVAALNSYREEASLLPMVACCRTAQYEELPQPLYLNSAVEVQPLTRDDLSRWIENLGPNGAALRQLLASDNKLLEFTTTPLMLGVLWKVANSRPEFSIAMEDHQSEYVEHLFDEYVRQVLAESPRVAGANSKQLNPSTIRAWLGRLASQLEARQVTAFYPDWLQADWLPKRWQVWLLIETVRLLPAFALAVAAWTASSQTLYQRFLTGFATLLVLGGLTLILAPSEPILKISVVKPSWRWHTDWSSYAAYLIMIGIQAFLIILTIEVLRHPPSPPSGASIIVVAVALASPAGFFAVVGLISENGISEGVPIRKIRPSVVRAVYALGFAVAYSAAFLAVSGTLYLIVFTANPQFIRASGATAPGFMKATFIILVLAEPFFLWNIITRHLVRRKLLQALLMAQGVLPRNLYAILSHARLHMLLHHVGDGYFFTHPILLEYFSHQGYRASPPTSLPTRSNERQIGTWAVFAGFVLVAVKLTLENVWRGTWQGGLEAALVVGFLMTVPRLPSGGYITIRIVIPPPGSWKVPELRKQLAEPSPYIFANAQRTAQIALGDANRRIRLARENSRLIDSLTSLTTLREPGLAKEVVHSLIIDGVVLGSYLAREDSKPARIPNLTRALMIKPDNILLNGDQTGITVYAVYAAYKLTCSSALGRYLFLRRMARVERRERASLDDLRAPSF